MAVAVDAITTGGNSSDGDCIQGDNVTSFTDANPIIVGVGATLLIATIGWQETAGGGDPTTRDITWNGVSMTEAAFAGGAVGDCSAAIYYTVSPSTGTLTFAGSWTNTCDVYAAAISFTGTDTSTGIAAADTVTQVSTTESLSVASTTDGGTVALGVSNSGDPTMTQTSFWENSPLGPGGGGSYALGGTSNSHGFDFAGGNDKVIVGVHVLAGAGGGGTFFMHDKMLLLGVS